VFNGVFYGQLAFFAFVEMHLPLWLWRICLFGLF